jgi:hypothetical protein
MRPHSNFNLQRIIYLFVLAILVLAASLSLANWKSGSPELLTKIARANLHTPQPVPITNEEKTIPKKTEVSAVREMKCPAGYHHFEDDKTVCISNKHPEPMWEIELRQREWMTSRSAPFDSVAPGAFSNAMAQRQQIENKPPKITGVDGSWEPVGQGPLISNSETYPRTSGLGLVHVAGRIDNFAYDAANNRLFATKGTGGIWMSEDLGDNWRSIGDSLPSQIIGAVAWSSANGGTLIAVSGDPAMGSYTYTGFGAFYSRDLGVTWQKAQGIPDGAPGFAAEVDPQIPTIVYAATLFGLYRSTDAGVTYTNVALPTGACAGVEGGATGRPECHLANVVTDVVIKTQGGVNPTVPGAEVQPGTVLAVVGWRSGKRQNADGSVQSEGNGLYRSATGERGTFVKLEATGFTPQHRIGRTELAAAIGPQQDHNFVYAIVQDAEALNGGLEILDTPEGVTLTDPGAIGPTLPLLGVAIREAGGSNLNGVYVSADFGATWKLMADDNVIAKNPATGSALVVVGQAIGYEPGVQAWYNLFIAPDPTSQTVEGIPTRLTFGLEEVWQNEVVGQPMNGPVTFKVIGRYFSGESCMLLGLDLPECPTARPPTTSNTTHPDQHAVIWIPDGNGGVTLAVGNDGGFYKQHVAAGEELDNGGWGDGNQTGFHTLLPYDVAIAKDGTVYAGLQDNGHLKITPTGEQYTIFGGDGTFAEVDPDNSNIAYEATPGADMRVTIDGGTTWRDMPPPITNARFVNPFQMDPTDANHIVTAGRQVAETVWGPNTGLIANEWQRVFDMGTNQHPGDPNAVAGATDPANVVSALDVHADAAYVGFCGPCTHINQQVPFKRGIATNVGGTLPAKRMSSDGWHFAKAQGLPNRYIMGIAIDSSNPKTIYVALGGYSVRWIPPGTLQDQNQNVGVGHVFKSTDGGENFIDISGNLPDVPATSIALRGKQLIVGTDVGVFASDVRGGTTYAVLGTGLPVVPISTLQMAPADCNELVAATYGRGIYRFRFGTAIKGKNPCEERAGGGELADFVLVPRERIHSGTHAWWSGSQGGSDSHVTRAITVPAGAAQMKFWTWYNLEDGFDWAYVLVSVDNGATWEPLPTVALNGSGTTPLDPIGGYPAVEGGGPAGGNKKYLHGFTGVSGYAPTFTGQNGLENTTGVPNPHEGIIVPVYTEQTAVVTSYAGKSILVRFAHSSDPAVDLDNFYVDDLRFFGALGNQLFYDDMEAIGNWQSGGVPGFKLVTASN